MPIFILEQTKTAINSLLQYLELIMIIMDFCTHSSWETVNGSDVCPPVTGATIVSPTLMFSPAFSAIFSLSVPYIRYGWT